jgi:hypothetical protein
MIISLLLLLGSLAIAQQDDLIGNPESSIENTSTNKMNEVNLIYTGQRNGVSAERYPFPIISVFDNIFSEMDDIVPEIHSHHNVLAQNQWVFYTEDRKVSSVIKFFNSDKIVCSEAIELSGSQRTFETVFPHNLSTDNIIYEQILESTGSKTTFIKKICTNQNGFSGVLIAPKVDAEKEPVWKLNAFEFRQAFSVRYDDNSTVQEINIVGSPVQEISRTYAYLTTFQQNKNNSLFVDAGSFLDGSSSVKPGGVSLHRELNYTILQNLKPAALAPGYSELILGAEYFIQEKSGKDLPYIATNWHSEDDKLSLPTYKIIEHPLGENDSIRIGFVAILDPELENLIPDLNTEDVSITNPIDETQKIINMMIALDSPPDVIIALTTASPKLLGDIRRQVTGIDLMIGDPSLATLRVEQRNIQFVPWEKTTKGAAVTLPMDGVSSISLQFDAETKVLNSATNIPKSIRSNDPINPQITSQITQNRSAYYADLDTPLIRPPGLGFEQKFSQDTWSSLVCETTRTALNADTVLLRELPSISNVPGVLTEKQVADSLAVMDVLEIHYIQGSRLQRFLDQAYGHVPIACGAVPGSKFPKPRGRSIDPDRLYRVVTTDRTRLSSPLHLVLPSHQVRRIFDQRMTTDVTDENGNSVTLRKLVVDSLITHRDTYGVAEMAPIILNEFQKEVAPILLFRSRSISLSLEDFTGTDNDTYSQVPETMATSPSSSTIGHSSDLAFEYLSPKIRSDIRYRSNYSRLQTEDDEQEVSDDWKLSTSISAPGLALDTNNLLWMPYGEVLYDSEFTPIELDDGTFNTQQSDLSFTMGLSTLPWKMVRNIKIGALANRDIAQFQEKPTEYGGHLQWETKKALMSYMIWTTSGDVQLFANTPDDDASDLRWRLYGQTKLSMPLARYLSVSLYGNGLGLQGRTSANDEFGFAWNLGCSLDVSGAFELSN